MYYISSLDTIYGGGCLFLFSIWLSKKLLDCLCTVYERVEASRSLKTNFVHHHKADHKKIKSTALIVMSMQIYID